ncbi:MAG: SET domain-containing protein-lysine N-methyltransferase [Rhizobiales bacterium]|nr:SET domain-containing protein-lysine N-methyltransferase [Hyphomicrobiales bacterium]
MELLGDGRPADHGAAFQYLHPQPGHSQIGCAGQAVVTGPNDHDVIDRHPACPSTSRPIGSIVNRYSSADGRNKAPPADQKRRNRAGLENSDCANAKLLPSRALRITTTYPQRHDSDHRARSHLPRKRSRTADQVRIGRSNSGLGLFATAPFKKGEFVAQYWGRKVSDEEADRIDNKYLFELNDRWTIDGSNRRNIARYINHSCRPNGKIDISGGKIIIRAKRKIQAGEEITYNYGRNYFTAFIKPVGCRCAACKQAKKSARAQRTRSKKR